MCITNLSQLNAAYLLNAGGCTSITAQLADLLKRQQRRCTLDTENSIVREGDGFEYRVCLSTLKVTLLNGAITTADNSALCYLQRVPMKGYVIKEMCMFDNEPSSAKAAHGQLFRNLRELVTLTGMMFH